MSKKDAKRIDRLVDSLELVSARILESVIQNNQIASFNTPEMRSLFDKWLECLQDELLENAFASERIDIKKTAEAMSIREDTLLALLLALVRKGKIGVVSVTTTKGSGKNNDICDCMEV